MRIAAWLRRQRAHFGDEGARRGHREMGAHRLDARPLLDEHQPVGVFDIDMAVVRQTPRLAARPRTMLGAERDHALAMLGGEDDVAGDEDHNRVKTQSARIPLPAAAVYILLHYNYLYYLALRRI